MGDDCMWHELHKLIIRDNMVMVWRQGSEREPLLLLSRAVVANSANIILKK